MDNLLTNPVRGSDDRLINPGDLVAFTAKNHGYIRIGTYLGYRLKETLEPYVPKMRLRRTYTWCIQGEERKTNLVDKYWEDQIGFPQPKTSRMVKMNG